MKVVSAGVSMGADGTDSGWKKLVSAGVSLGAETTGSGGEAASTGVSMRASALTCVCFAC